MFNPLEDAAWVPLVPTVAQVSLVVDVMRGEAVGTASLLLVAASSLALAALFLLALVRLLRSERIVFGR